MARNELRDRIVRRLAELERSPIDAAKAAGLERNFINDIVNGKKNSFAAKYQERVALALNWSIDELLGKNNVERRSSLSYHNAENAIVPEIDVRAGASYAGGYSIEETIIDDSGGSVSRDAIRANWGIPPPFLRDELRIAPGRAHILPIRGDSMVDTLYDGDRAIIDLDDTDISQGGIFALLDDNGSLIIKQVELVRQGSGPRRIVCKSRNPQYAPFELLLAEPVRVIGRVACRITRL